MKIGLVGLNLNCNTFMIFLTAKEIKLNKNIIKKYTPLYNSAKRLWKKELSEYEKQIAKNKKEL